MKVRELVATLLTLPQEATVYTEQWTSNEIAAVAVSRSKDVVIIGDDLDGVIEDAEDGLKPVEHVIIPENPVIYTVTLESFDAGVPFYFSENYTNLQAARDTFNAWVEYEKGLRKGSAQPFDCVQNSDQPDYYIWRNDTTGDYSHIWIQERQIWDKSGNTKEQE